jgi:hypothetical protein
VIFSIVVLFNVALGGDSFNVTDESARSVVNEYFQMSDEFNRMIYYDKSIPTEYSLSYSPETGEYDESILVPFEDVSPYYLLRTPRYSKIVGVGFRTRSEFIKSLCVIYTPEFAEELYNRLLGTDIGYPMIVEKDGELWFCCDRMVYGISPDMVYDNTLLTVESITENRITVRKRELALRWADYIVREDVYSDMILEKTPDGWRISQIGIAWEMFNDYDLERSFWSY